MNPALHITPLAPFMPRPFALSKTGGGALRLKGKASLFRAGEPGRIWRLIGGALALEAQGDDATCLAGLALPGDLVGIDGHVLGCMPCSARALVPSEVLAWPVAQGELGQAEMLRALLRQQQRTAALLALRQGTAQERVTRLIRLLSPSGLPTALPTLRDMSLLTHIAPESICREMARLRQEGRLVSTQGRHTLVDEAAAAAELAAM